MVDIDAILETHVPERELRAVLKDALAAVQLSFDRALGHLESPNAFPLPRRPDALERRIRRQVAKLSAEALGHSRQAAMARLTAPSQQRRAHYGRLADIDLRSNAPIVDQARSLPRLPTAGAAHDQLLARLRRTTGQEPQPRRMLHRAQPATAFSQASAAAPVPSPSGPPEWLVLRAKRLHCVTDTSEWFRDEIEIAGVSTNLCSGESAVLSPQKLGKWKKDQNEALDPVRTLARYRLGDGPEPVPFIATLVLAEADLGGLGAHVRDLHTVHEVGFLTDVVTGAAAAALGDLTRGELALGAGAALGIGAVLAVALPGLFTVLAGVLVAVCVALLVDRVFRRFGDEIFEDVPVMQAIGGRGARFPGRPAGALTSTDLVQDFRRPQGNGLYKLTYDWAIETA